VAGRAAQCELGALRGQLVNRTAGRARQAVHVTAAGSVWRAACVCRSGLLLGDLTGMMVPPVASTDMLHAGNMGARGRDSTVPCGRWAASFGRTGWTLHPRAVHL
jgi:hypothetical protein